MYFNYANLLHFLDFKLGLYFVHLMMCNASVFNQVLCVGVILYEEILWFVFKAHAPRLIVLLSFSLNTSDILITVFARS